jgi:hypothetical protein
METRRCLAGYEPLSLMPGLPLYGIEYFEPIQVLAEQLIRINESKFTFYLFGFQPLKKTKHSEVRCACNLYYSTL